MSQPSFEECRRQAYRLAGNAADQIRYGDWQLTPEQREAIRDALRLFGEAKDALNRAAR